MAEEGFLNIDASAGEDINKLLTKTASGVKNIVAETKKATKGGSILKQLFGDDKETKQMQLAQKEFERTLNMQRQQLQAVNREMQNAKSLTHLDALQERARGIKDEMKKAMLEYRQMQQMRGAGGMGMGGMGVGVAGQSANSMTQLLRQFGDMDSSIGRLSEVVDTTGNLIDTVGQLSENFSQIMPVLTKVGGSVLSFVGKIPLVGGALSGVLGSVGGSLTALLGAALPVTAAIAALILILKAQDEATQDQRRHNQGFLNTQQQFYEDLDTMSREEMQEASTDLQERINLLRQQQGELAGSYDQTFEEASRLFNSDVIARAVTGIATITGQLPDASSRMNELGQEIADAEFLMGRYTGALADNSTSAEDVERAHEELTSILEREAQAAQEYKEQLKQFNDELKLSRSRELEDRALADRRTAENHANELRGIEEQGNQRIEDIREESLKSIADLEKDYRKVEEDALNDLTKALADLIEETQKAEGELKSRYMESQTKELKRHIKDMARAENDYQKERLRRLEDLNDELLAAEMENDVVRFIQAQQQGEKDLRRMAEDHNEELSQGEQDWLEERQEQREQFQQELEDLRNNAIERRTELQEQYDEEKAERATEHGERLAEIRAQAAERVAAERTGVAAQIEEVKKRYEEERRLLSEDRALQDRRQQEDNDRRLKQMQEQNDKETKLLNDEAAVQLAIIQGGQDAVGQVMISSYTNMVNKLKQIAAAATSSFGSFGSSQQSSSGGGKPGGPPAKKSIFAAEGGLFGPRSPTTVTLGEGRYPEAVVPIKHSRLPGGMGGPTFAMNGDIIISGADVTKADVEAAFAQFALVTAQSIADQRAGYSGGYG